MFWYGAVCTLEDLPKSKLTSLPRARVNNLNKLGGKLFYMLSARAVVTSPKPTATKGLEWPPSSKQLKFLYQNTAIHLAS